MLLLLFFHFYIIMIVISIRTDCADYEYFGPQNRIHLTDRYLKFNAKCDFEYWRGTLRRATSLAIPPPPDAPLNPEMAVYRLTESIKMFEPIDANVSRVFGVFICETFLSRRSKRQPTHLNAGFSSASDSKNQKLADVVNWP